MGVHEKILSIMRDVRYLAKDDKVEYKNTRYRALSEEKVTSIMRERAVEHGLIVYPIEQSCERSGQITHVDVKYRIYDTESGEHIDVVSCGDGADSQDKGAGKAMTYAYKYMWLRTFAIPTGEDPDKVSSAELDAKQAAENKLIGEKEQSALIAICKAKGLVPDEVFPKGLNLTAEQYIEAAKNLSKLPDKNV